MSRLLAIDPGARHAGAALFTDGRLIAASGFAGTGFGMDLFNVIDLVGRVAAWAGKGVDHVVMEWPQVYAGRQRGRKDPNDLLPLAAFNGALLAHMCPGGTELVTSTLYRPHDWKGSKKANPTARWILSRLTPEETARVEDYSAFVDALDDAETAGVEISHPSHDVVDACGLGLHHLKRLGRHRVIAR